MTVIYFRIIIQNSRIQLKWEAELLSTAEKYFIIYSKNYKVL